jgi:hypothetical protein
MENKTKPKADYPIVVASAKGKLHLSKKLMEQINMLHDFAGNTEWSGPIFYKVNKGSISKPETIDIEAFAMYPMDIGTPGYTEYDFQAEETFDMHDYYPEIVKESWDMGHMHTHHTMKAYFSGTDEQELKDNTPQHAYYLSLIVNHAKEYVARLCVMGKRIISGESGVSYTGIDGKSATNKANIKQKQDIVYVINLEVAFDDHQHMFMEQVHRIQERAQKRKEALEKERVKNLSAYGIGSSNSQYDLWSGRGDKDHNKPYTRGSHLGNNQWLKDFTGNGRNNEEEKIHEDLPRDFVYKLISCNYEAEGHLPTLIATYELKYTELSDAERDIFAEQIDEKFVDIYEYVYGDVGESSFHSNMEEVLHLLAKYQTSYEVIDFLIERITDYEIQGFMNM